MWARQLTETLPCSAHDWEASFSSTLQDPSATKAVGASWDTGIPLLTRRLLQARKKWFSFVSKSSKRLLLAVNMAAHRSFGFLDSGSLLSNMGSYLYNDYNAASFSEETRSEGYDEFFDPPLESKYECPICLLGLREPVQTSCGHRFCGECIKRSLRLVLKVCIQYDQQRYTLFFFIRTKFIRTPRLRFAQKLGTS